MSLETSRGGYPKKYIWTPERDRILREGYDGKVRGRAAEIGRDLGWPTWVIKKRAQQLGLCYPAQRQDWTEDEERFVFLHAGSRTALWMAKRLKRSESPAWS